METILKTTDLCKNYFVNKNEQQNILKNINLHIKQGEFVSLMGPSGSGKSTLLYNLSGMDTITSGSVVFNGKELATLSEKQLAQLRLQKMGFIFQQIHLLKNFSLFDNIIIAGYSAKKTDRNQVNQKAIELMEDMDILELANKDITQASGGQLQRVAICRALINNPDILFGDEPTGALNSKSAEIIMDILSSINQSGMTMLLATHDIKVAARTERVIYILDGKIVDKQYLGKPYSSSVDFKLREKQLSEWLMNMGF